MFDDVSSVINSFIASSNVFLVIYAALCLINGLVCKLELISGCQPGPEGAPGRQSPGANWPSPPDAADAIARVDAPIGPTAPSAAAATRSAEIRNARISFKFGT